MEENFVSAHGLKLATYERHGKSTALFFIHGNSSNANAFEDVWQQSALQGYYLISLDLPGHGKSDHAKDVTAYTMSSLGKLIAGVLDRKNLRNVILIGHSIGGHIALSVLNFTDRAAGIALAGTAPIEGAHDLSKAYIISEKVQTVFRGEVSNTEIHDFCLNAVYQEDKVPRLAHAFHGTDKRFREEMGIELSRHFGSENFKSEISLLKERRMPVCLIHGAKEKVVNVDYLRSLTGLNLFRNKVHLINDAGHCVPFEAPEQYSRILADFAAHLAPVTS